MVIADERVAVIARALLARTPLQPHFSSGPTHAEHRRTGRGTRCDVMPAHLRERRSGVAGALRLQGLRPAVVMQLASTGGLEPQALRPLPVTTYQVVAIEGVEPSTRAVVSCLLYPTELHCSGGQGCVLRGYTQQQRCSVPVWFEPQPLAPNAHQDLGDDERPTSTVMALIRILAVAARRTPFPPAAFTYGTMCIREPFGTPWSRNSIWSARILRLLRMKAS